MSRTRFYSIGLLVTFILLIVTLVYAGKEPLSILKMTGLMLILGVFFGLFPFLGAIINLLAQATWERLFGIDPDDGDQSLQLVLCSINIVILAGTIFLLVATLSGKTRPDMWSGNMMKYAPSIEQRVLLVGLDFLNKDEIADTFNVVLSDRSIRNLPTLAYESLKNDPVAMKMIIKKYLIGRFSEMSDIAKMALNDLKALGREDVINELFLEILADDKENFKQSARLLIPFVSDRDTLEKAKAMYKKEWPDDIRNQFKERLKQLEAKQAGN